MFNHYRYLNPPTTDAIFHPDSIARRAAQYDRLGNAVIAHQLWRLAAHQAWRLFRERAVQLRYLNRSLGAIRPVVQPLYGGGLNTHHFLAYTLREICWVYLQDRVNRVDFRAERAGFLGEMALILNDYPYEVHRDYSELSAACLEAYWGQKQIPWRCLDLDEYRAMRRFAYVAYRTGRHRGVAQDQVAALERQARDLKRVDVVQAHTHEDVLAGIYASEYGYRHNKTTALIDGFEPTPDRPWVSASRKDHRARAIASQAGRCSEACLDEGRRLMEEAISEYSRFGIVPEPHIEEQLSLKVAAGQLRIQPASLQRRGRLILDADDLRRIFSVVRGDSKTGAMPTLPNAIATWTTNTCTGLELRAPTLADRVCSQEA